MYDVTTLIASFNGQEWILKAIESVEKQTVKCNICVVDDGSTDDSANVIKDYLFGSTVLPSIIDDQNGYFKYENGNNKLICLNKNSGPSHARNVGIEQTLPYTKYYAILDADDEFYPNKVERCLEILEKYPQVGIVYGDYDILNTRNGNLLREHKKTYSRSLLMRECIIHSGSVIRASVLKSMFELSGWYDVNLRCCEDWDLWLRATEKCIAWHIPESLTLVRSHENDSTSSVPNETWQRCWQYTAQKTRARLQKNAGKNIQK